MPYKHVVLHVNITGRDLLLPADEADILLQYQRDYSCRYYCLETDDGLIIFIGHRYKDGKAKESEILVLRETKSDHPNTWYIVTRISPHALSETTALEIETKQSRASALDAYHCLQAGAGKFSPGFESNAQKHIIVPLEIKATA